MDRISPICREYLSGSLASSFTATVFNPFEVVKTRLQLQDMPGWRRIYTSGFVDALRTIWKQEGLLLLWSHGLCTIVARDFFYSGVRTGMYPNVRSAIAGDRSPADTFLVQKIAAGAVCGGVGSALANPFDVVRVRMIAEGGLVQGGKLSTGMRAGHAPRWSSSISCCMDALKSEGIVRGLMLRGLGPSVSRAALLTAAQMSSYDHTKVLAKQYGLLSEGLVLHCVGAGISGLAAQVACNPADVLKSRVMSVRSSGASSTVFGVATHIIKNEGMSAFYKGFGPAYARIGPTIFFQMPIAEALRAAMGVRSL